MSKLVLQYSVLNNTEADAVPVEANFNRIESHVNQEVIERAGSVAMTGQLKLAGNPVAVDDAASKGYVDSLFPIGFINMFGGTTPPPGGVWLLCDGTELDTASYPELFAVIGVAFGSASAGRFNLPDMRDRTPMGASTAKPVGASGGANDAIVPAHVHTVDHTHAGTQTTVESAAHVHGVSIQSGGASTRHYHPMNPMEFIRYNPFAPTATLAGTAPGSGVPIDVFQMSGGLTTSWDDPDHSHGVNGASGGQNVNHTHGVNVPTFNGNSGPASGAAASVTNANLPPYRAVNYLIKAR